MSKRQRGTGWRPRFTASSCHEEAILDLLRLERYERRAWARQRLGAKFLNLKFTETIIKQNDCG